MPTNFSSHASKCISYVLEGKERGASPAPHGRSRRCMFPSNVMTISNHNDVVSLPLVVSLLYTENTFTDGSAYCSTLLFENFLILIESVGDSKSLCSLLSYLLLITQQRTNFINLPRKYPFIFEFDVNVDRLTVAPLLYYLLPR